MSNERFPTPGGVPSLVSSDGRWRHVSILGDLAGTPPAECRSSAWRGPALFAATFVVMIAGTLWLGYRSTLGAPHSALAPRVDARTGATQSPAPVGDAGSAAQTSPTSLEPLAVPSAAVIVNVAPAGPATVQAAPADAVSTERSAAAVAPAGPATVQAAPADAVSTERSAAAVATSRTPAKASPTPRAASRLATQPRRRPAPAAPADEPDIDIITAIVRHASPER
jgi:hypothetical protein